jgi:hypothetical protein
MCPCYHSYISQVFCFKLKASIPGVLAFNFINSLFLQSESETRNVQMLPDLKIPCG